MFLLEDGGVVDRAIETRYAKGGGFSYNIWWNRVVPIMCSYHKLNQVLDELEGKQLDYKETAKGAKTISSIGSLGIGYFVRKNKDDVNNIEICGVRASAENDLVLFRYKVKKSYDSEFGALDAWIEFQVKVSDKIGKTLSEIYGGLPQAYHKYRTCVPSPINWAHPYYCLERGKVAEDCVKADICSAYGTEASKTLPDCHPDKIQLVDGLVEPTEEFPFAFYLESGHMAIWQEGDTFQLNQSAYITNDHTKPVFSFEERTLLMPVADGNLRDVFEELYEGRKDNPDNKSIMNMTIGMFHRKKSRLDSENLWPLAAVIKFRCNKRIIDTCEMLKFMGHTPILINTDSIMWRGSITSGMEIMFSDEKKLGNFTYEYKDCRAVMRSSKIYQIQDKETGETITRWSGSHTKKYTSQLAFGQIWQESVYDYLRKIEQQNTIRWDDKQRRFINQLGEIYEDTEEIIDE